MINNLDIYIAGLGGQGILTIGEILARAAAERDLNVNFYPTKGMSQRGGFVQAQLRISEDEVGPSLSPRGADVIIALERSESLKAMRYVSHGADFLLYDNIWSPTSVLLGKATYPQLDQVREEGKKKGANMLVVSSENLPEYAGKPVRDNIYLLGAAMGHTQVGQLFSLEEIEGIVADIWPKVAEANIFTLRAGAKSTLI